MTLNQRPMRFPEDTMRKLLRRNALSNAGKILGKMRAEDIASGLESFNQQEARLLFDQIHEPEKSAEVFSESCQRLREVFVLDREEESLRALFKDMSDDDLADFLSHLPEEQAAGYTRMMGADGQTVKDLLEFEEDTAGRIMSTEFLALKQDVTVGEAIDIVRKEAGRNNLFYVYVVNGENLLVGVVSLRQLIVSDVGVTLDRIMTREVINVVTDMDQEEVARVVERYNLLAVPVVDEVSHLMGIITVDDVIDVIREEATEDIYKMVGASGDELLEDSVWRITMMRMPWLAITLVGETITGMILKYYNQTLTRIIAVVFFIPLIMALGGNVGNQSQTIINRGLATGHIEERTFWKVVLRQFRVGALMGLLAGLMVTMIAYLVEPSWIFASVVGISLFISINVSSLVGTLAPIFLKRIRVDPAVSAGPFITNFNDIVGTTVYLTLVTYFLVVLPG